MRLRELRKLVEQISGGGGLNLGAWQSIDEWLESPSSAVTGRFPDVTPLTVPSEIIVVGYFEDTASEASIRLHEGVPGSNLDKLIHVQDSVASAFTTIMVRGIIAPNVQPVMSLSGGVPEKAVIDIAKRRPLG